MKSKCRGRLLAAVHVKVSLQHYLSKGIVITSVIIIALILGHQSASTAKVLDIGASLPEFIAKHTDKSWLIKFYAPWCHYCQQLEPTYANVAERIYHKYDNLVVGRVDCSKHSAVCQEFQIDSYPTILHLTRDTRVRYRGDRTEESLVSFADRLSAPDVNIIGDCNQLKAATNKHGLIVLSTFLNSSEPLHREFFTIARSLKSNYWFFQFRGTCKDFIKHEGLYLLKKNLNRPIIFKNPTDLDDNNYQLNATIIEWMHNESFPIYGQINQGNIERSFASGRLLVLAILEEYKPARRFLAPSYAFYKYFEKIATKYAEHDEQLLFGWTADLDLVEYITLASVKAPNVMLLRSDLSYYLLNAHSEDLKNDDKQNEESDYIPEKLKEHKIKPIIAAAKASKLKLSGGNSFFYTILRYTIGNYSKFMRLYRANPLLVSLLFGLPSIIVIFVIYTTCCYEGRGGDDDEDQFDSGDEDFDEEEREHLLARKCDDHLKKD